MPFFRSGSGGTPGRIFNLSGKEAVPPAAQAQTEPVIQTQSTTEPERFRQPQAMPEPEPVRQPQDIPEPESIRQPETTPQPETIQQPKTIPQPEAARQPQTSYQKVEIQDIRKLPKATGICATTVFFCTVFQLSLSHVENAGNEWRKTTVSWNSGNL